MQDWALPACKAFLFLLHGPPWLCRWVLGSACHAYVDRCAYQVLVRVCAAGSRHELGNGRANLTRFAIPPSHRRDLEGSTLQKIRQAAERQRLIEQLQSEEGLS